MIEDIYKYFIDLENSNCQKNGNIIVRNDVDFSKEKFIAFKNHCANILNIPFHLKKMDKPNGILQPIVSSKLYKHCNFITPPIFVTSQDNHLHQTTQNVHTIPLDILIASKVTCSPKYRIHKIMSKPNYPSSQSYKWLFITNLKDIFLEFMTPKCLDEFFSIFLVDELRTEQDCHDDNYFLYKSRESDKYEGIIRFDFDNTYITKSSEIATQEDFNYFLQEKYETFDPFLRKDWISYKDRHNELRELLNDDFLSDNNIVALHNALEFDLPNAIKETGKKYNLEEDEIDEIYTPIAMLWEYNRKHLGKDLEM